jgi:quinone-modifying oxidoreductase subunit QmoC
MAAIPVMPSADVRDEILKRGGDTASRCYQCATCSSVCELTPDETPFPRRQMLWAQWGLADRIAAAPGVWLCHQCNDCTVRCPRDARPGNVMQSLRAIAIEHLAVPSFLGKLVGRVRSTWPILILVPLLFWFIAAGLVNSGLNFPEAREVLSPVNDSYIGQYLYDEFVPHWLIYVVFFPIVGWVCLAALISGLKLWKLMGEGVERGGSFIGKLIPAVIEIGLHKRFDTCDGKVPPRRWGHFLTMWGFVGALITTTAAVIYLYLFHYYPVPLTHWMKWLGNFSSVILIVGVVLLIVNRMRDSLQVGGTAAFDRFFLGVVAAVIFSGVLTEAARFLWAPAIGCCIYLIHLSAIMILFFTFPYSKFAHLLYRILAMVHQMMVEEAKAKTAEA